MVATLEMFGRAQERRRRLFTRLSILLLLIIPFIPEIAISATAALARIGGCQPDEVGECRIAGVPVRDVIGWALEVKARFINAHAGDPRWATAFYLIAAIWLLACYFVVLRGWRRRSSRLVLGLILTLLFAVMPYFGSLLAIAPLANDSCQLDASRSGPCMIFGGYVGDPESSPAHAAGRIVELVIIGAPLALGMFAFYAVGVIAVGRRAAKRPTRSA
jgi:hypothetical protein